MKRLLILGGTAEARQLAEQSVAGLVDRLEVITSWAGRTDRAPDVAGRTRLGGFGGAAGLADYLAAEAVDLLVDATHPFAETISMAAHDAAVIADVPRLMLLRPPWRLPPSARWVEVEDLAAAADAVGRFSRRAFLTTGRQTVEAFAGVENVWFLVRLIDPPSAPLPLAAHAVTTGRPPHDLAAEKALIAEHRIDTLVSKSSGGTLPAKITAALELAMPIVLVAPPPPPPGPRAATVEECLGWIESRL